MGYGYNFFPFFLITNIYLGSHHHHHYYHKFQYNQEYQTSYIIHRYYYNLKCIGANALIGLDGVSALSFN